MSKGRERRIHGFGLPLRARVSEAVAQVITPVSMRGVVRLTGLALVAEALFLTLVSVEVPVGGLALLSLLAGEAVFVASFAPGGRRTS